VNAQKSVTGFATIFPTNYPTSYGYHFNFGAQREIKPGLVIQGDFVSRQFLRRSFGTTVDANRFNSAEGPVIPRCTGTQSTDPRAQCSVDAIQVRDPNARSSYRGLLVKLDKRLANRWLLTASYAYAHQYSVLTIINKRDWFAGYGEYGSRQVFNVSGVLDLPKGFQISMISSMSSRAPVNPGAVGGAATDIDGDGTATQWLPGAGVSRFNRGFGRRDLTRLIDEWNNTYGGKPAPRGGTISRLVAPSGAYQFGDNFFSQDFRVTKVIPFRDRYKLNVFGEVFNAFNFANLGGFAYNLLDPGGFGRPTTRAGQVFGSGGPRAFQVGTRLSF